MRRLTPLLGAAAAAVLLLAVAAARADEEEKVALDKVPQPILDAVKERFKDAKLAGASKEKEDGKLVYEVTVKDKDKKIDVTLTPEGEILMIEKQIDAKDLPEAVAKALEDKYPEAKVKIIEEIVKVKDKDEKLDAYEVLLVTADKKVLEVKLSAKGKVLEVEKKRSDKDDD